MEEKIKRNIMVEIEYTESKFDDKNNIYYGKIKSPQYLEELSIDLENEYVFDLENDNWEETGNYNVYIQGTNRALKELGIYFLNLALYETQDPDYHDHLDNIATSKGDVKINIIASKNR